MNRNIKTLNYQHKKNGFHKENGVVHQNGNGHLILEDDDLKGMQKNTKFRDQVSQISQFQVVIDLSNLLVGELRRKHKSIFTRIVKIIFFSLKLQICVLISAILFAS